MNSHLKAMVSTLAATTRANRVSYKKKAFRVTPISLALGMSIDVLLWLCSMHLKDAVRIFREGSEKLIGPLVNSRDRLQAYNDAVKSGFTLIVNGVERVCPQVSSSSALLAKSIGARISCNLYITPASATGFALHSDPHDVVVAQLQGSKIWTLDTCADKHSLPSGKDITLRSGDVLYIPASHFHRARTNNQHSIHLTYGIHKSTLLDMVRALIRNPQPKRQSGNGNRRSKVTETVIKSVLGVIGPDANIERVEREVEESLTNTAFTPLRDGITSALLTRSAIIRAKFRKVDGTDCRITSDRGGISQCIFIRSVQPTMSVAIHLPHEPAKLLMSAWKHRAQFSESECPAGIGNAEWSRIFHFLLAHKFISHSTKR